MIGHVLEALWALKIPLAVLLIAVCAAGLVTKQDSP